jgi:hypothetical protein
MPRFGPLLPAPEAARRSLLEHVVATGRFLWRERETKRLVQRTRAAMLKRLALSHPGWAALPEPELRTQLAALSGLSELDIMRALHKEDFAHPHEFTNLIRNLEHMRKLL